MPIRWILVAFVLYATAPHARAIGDTTYAVTDADVAHLQYYATMNTFDSAVVVHQFGELRLATSVSERRIDLDTIMHRDTVCYNGSGMGLQEYLLPVLRSFVFTVDPAEDSLRFYRELSLRAYSQVAQRMTSAWTLPDRSSWSVVLVRAGDGVELAVLDSVGIDSTSVISTSVPTFGTSASTYCRTVAVPPNAKGIPVYVQIRPYRQGTTTYGMYSFRRASWVSLSTLQQCGPTMVGSPAIVAMKAERFSRLIDYLDQEFLEYCSLPSLELLELSSEEGDSLLRRYYTIDTTFTASSTVRRHRPIECESFKRSLLHHRRSGASMSLRGTRASGTALRTTIVTEGPARIDLLLIETTTGAMVHAGSVGVPGGATPTTLPTALPSGAYILRAYDADRHVYAVEHIVVVR